MSQINIEIKRFDNDLININTQEIHEGIKTLYEKYPEFMPVFVEDILGIPVSDTTSLIEQLPKFLDDTIYGFKYTNSTEQEIFKDISHIQTELNKAFTKIHYLYQELPIPVICFFISGFNSSIFFYNDNIAVGADMYLGSDYKYYNQVVYDYQKYNMRPECIPIDITCAYLFHYIPYNSDKNRLLENMIYRGKIIYLLSQLFPQQEQYDIIGYTKEQWKWCKYYERAIWNRIMDKHDIFKTENIILTSYLNDGPFTAEISQDSPPRIGTWIGWQIVDSYMENNRNISLQQLLEESDAEYILENSKYRP